MPGMQSAFVRIAAVLLATASLSALQPSAAPTFDVASVKPADPDILRSRGLDCGFLPSGRFHALGNLRWLVACAYDLRPAQSRQQIVGAPKWADDDLFEIRATFSPSQLTASQRLAMLQMLLAERFKLVAHREQRQVPGYALVIAHKSGKLGRTFSPHRSSAPSGSKADDMATSRSSLAIWSAAEGGWGRA